MGSASQANVRSPRIVRVSQRRSPRKRRHQAQPPPVGGGRAAPRGGRRQHCSWGWTPCPASERTPERHGVAEGSGPGRSLRHCSVESHAGHCPGWRVSGRARSPSPGLGGGVPLLLPEAFLPCVWGERSQHQLEGPGLCAITPTEVSRTRSGLIPPMQETDQRLPRPGPTRPLTVGPEIKDDRHLPFDEQPAV